jgi:hypothetical protein
VEFMIKYPKDQGCFSTSTVESLRSQSVAPENEISCDNIEEHIDFFFFYLFQDINNFKIVFQSNFRLYNRGDDLNYSGVLGKHHQSTEPYDIYLGSVTGKGVCAFVSKSFFLFTQKLEYS